MHCIPGSLLIPDYEIKDKIADVVPDKDITIIVYCRRNRQIRAKTLIDMGYTKVFDLGGIIDWPLTLKGTTSYDPVFYSPCCNSTLLLYKLGNNLYIITARICCKIYTLQRSHIRVVSFLCPAIQFIKTALHTTQQRLFCLI